MDKQLLFSVMKKDFKISYFSGTGAGGQHRNRHMNCVRMTHKDSEASATGQSSKSKIKNTEEAFNTIVKSIPFLLWHTRMVNEKLSGKSIEDLVDEAMDEKNLRIEYADKF